MLVWTCVILSIILLKLFFEPSYVKILLFLEVFGLSWYLILLTYGSVSGLFGGVNLFVFSLLVLEGIIGLYGLILLFNFSGKTFFSSKNA